MTHRFKPTGEIMMMQVTDDGREAVSIGEYSDFEVVMPEDKPGRRPKPDATFNQVIYEGNIIVDGRRTRIARRDKNEKRINPAWQSGNPRSIRQTRAGGRR
jgi:hypothetical protein